MIVQADLITASWVKSSFSSGGDNCVEVALGGRTVGIRDSKARLGPQLAVSTAAFTTFLAGAKGNRWARTG